MNYLNKKSLTLFIALLLLALFACRNDDVITEGPFIDRNLGGTIFGDSWEFKSGLAKSVAYQNGPFTYYHSIALREYDESICDSIYLEDFHSPFIIEERYLLLGRYDSFPVMRPGLYALETVQDKNDFSLWFNALSDSGKSIGYGQSGGYFEIIQVDTVRNTISGKLSGRDNLYGIDTWVNGNFEVMYCK
ncbi:MAG: hypothetical protein RH860_12290 [Cytophagales bacterium]